MIVRLYTVLILTVSSITVLYSQTINVSQIQPLSFGNIINSGNGGDIIIDYNGGIQNTGALVLTGNEHQQLIFNIDSETTQSVLLTIPDDQKLTCEGSNETIDILIGPTDKGLNFILNPLPYNNLLNVGATLYVKSSVVNPACRYSGTIEIEFTIVTE